MTQTIRKLCSSRLSAPRMTPAGIPLSAPPMAQRFFSSAEGALRNGLACCPIASMPVLRMCGSFFNPTSRPICDLSSGF